MGAGEPVLRGLAQKLGIAQHVIFTGLVTDAELRVLYSAARVYVCPSLYEGFGFTVLEAMACGTPVVCSSATSLPEVAGKAALYFDPHKPGAMAAQLQSAFSDDAVRASLIANGRSNLLRFSWEETARQMLAAYYHALQLPLPRAAYA
jgi:glycosyltransferase involved in cell wall biosynthesis